MRSCFMYLIPVCEVLTDQGMVAITLDLGRSITCPLAKCPGLIVQVAEAVAAVHAGEGFCLPALLHFNSKRSWMVSPSNS